MGGGDEVADSSLDGQISFIKEGGHGVVVSVAAQDEHGQVVGADGVAVDVLVELVSQNDVGRNFSHEEEFEVRTSFQSFFFHDGSDFGCFCYGAAEGDHAVQVLQAVFFTDFLYSFQFKTESSGVLGIVVAGCASPAQEVSRFYWFVFVAAFEVSVFAGLEVGEAEYHGPRSQGTAYFGNAFGQHIDDFFRFALFDEVERMFMDEGGPDEFFTHQADAVAGEACIFISQVRIAQVHHDAGAGGAVYSPALTDFTLMMEGTSYMFLTGPKVVKTVTGEDVSQENLGGASVHSTKSGVTHFTAKTEEEGLALIRKLLSYIPQNNLEEAPYTDCTDPIDRLEDSLNDIIPDNPNKPYDMYEVIGAIVDNGEFLEIQKDYSKNIIIGFARFNGQSVGIVANQPKYLAGVLDSNASRKGARFVRFCDAFNIPIVSLVDVPGFLPGTGQEYNGVILHGAKLLYAYGEATVPKVTITLRKSYGGSHIVMSCKQLRGDMNYAWPTAEIAVMGGAGAVEVLYAREAKEQENPAQFLAEKEAEYTKLFANPYNAAKYGYIDDVIEPRNTRFRIIRALQQLQTKKLTNPAKKHGNIPL